MVPPSSEVSSDGLPKKLEEEEGLEGEEVPEREIDARQRSWLAAAAASRSTPEHPNLQKTLLLKTLPSRRADSTVFTGTVCRALGELVWGGRSG